MIRQYTDALVQRWNKLLFDRNSRRIRNTRPLPYQADDNIVVASMVGSASLDMYLIAIKSFMKNFGDARVEAINDGSLSAADLETLSHHIPGIAIANAVEVDTHSCPSYSSWKRLFRIVELSQSAYVVQLDSDIIATAPLAEIYNCARANRAFMIADGRWRETVHIDFMAAYAREWPQRHPQAMTERLMQQLSWFAAGDTYLRGCAGFAGYPKGSLTVDKVIQLSSEIEALIGSEVWRDWGSEQTATNCLLSKTPDPCILPWPRYQNYLFPPDNGNVEATALIHFIGSTRFEDSTYRILTKRVIQQLRSD
ncbi:hypothetical protein [Pseudomaricurvus sp. HS19]|uniref:hypothetical protein n=1 Tax=Pseudomaricurvus sp. HS19 TaxID=2692626 RepID=UPI0013716813|nr:hypothetical protein [Pseudomaricurvus sp. HS19]MYM62041.1 hypothetical protein [Pseudomaricurvus sp. HS19]